MLLTLHFDAGQLQLGCQCCRVRLVLSHEVLHRNFPAFLGFVVVSLIKVRIANVIFTSVRVSVNLKPNHDEYGSQTHSP